jgi:hypothetical protein
MDCVIFNAKSQIGEVDIIEHVENSKKIYEQCKRALGEHAVQTIQEGLTYVNMLGVANRTIEVDRLATKLAATSCRFHGQDQYFTERADALIETCRSQRFVTLVNEPDKDFQAMGYQKKDFFDLNDGTYDPQLVKDEVFYVVTGPIIKPRPIRKEDIDAGHDGQMQRHSTDIFPVVSDLVQPSVGCPVICRGLEKARHLNGKLGEVKAILNCSDGIRCEVHFKNKDLKRVAVKPVNLCIAFQLPEQESVGEMWMGLQQI